MSSTVALVQSTEYGTEQIEAAVRHAVDLLGGMSRFVQPGQRVLMKPNLLQGGDPAKAIITHPTVVRAVVKLAQEAGGLVLIADNPFIPPVNERGWDSLYERSGYAAIAAETGAELNNSIVPQQRPHPEGSLIKLVDTSSFLSEADVVISVPKLKTHDQTEMTCAIKAGYHVKLQTADRFANMLLDLVSFVQPALTVMDAVVGMDGDGPSAGQPFPIGAILAAPDPVELDVASLGLVGRKPTSVPTVAEAVARGWTTGRTSDLEVLGEDLATMAVSGFRLPPGGRSEMCPTFCGRWARACWSPVPLSTGDA